jgi:hypothetical protein
MLLSLFLLFACGEQAKECEPCPNCPEATASTEGKSTNNSGNSDLSEKELTLLKPYLDDIREGIRPFNEKGIGICKGLDRTCPDFLGTEVGDLPEGEYQLRADLVAPKLSPEDKWEMQVDINCEITRKLKNGDSKTNQDWSKSYKISHTNNKEHGYRLSPLRKITSPSKYGRQDCTYTMTAKNANGDKVFSGKWSVPSKEELEAPQ